MLTPEGKAPLPGQIFKNPTLAKSFRTIAEHGKKGYYEGPIAEAIVEGAPPSCNVTSEWCRRH